MRKEKSHSFRLYRRTHTNKKNRKSNTPKKRQKRLKIGGTIKAVGTSLTYTAAVLTIATANHIFLKKQIIINIEKPAIP